MTAGTWSIVTTVRTPREVLDRFLQYHLALGADRIFLYFDDPAMAWLYDDPRIEVTVCDDVYWSTRKRGARVVGRQVTNGSEAKARTRSEWLLHIDADELLWCAGNVSDAPAAVPADMDSVHVHNVEAVYTSEPTGSTAFGTTLFKTQVKPGPGGMPTRLVERVYGDLARLTRKGLFGHVHGKSFVRVAGRAEVSIHAPSTTGAGRRLGYRTRRLLLLHFDSLAYNDFRTKHLRRIDGASDASHLPSHRQNQMRMIAGILATEGEAELRDLYRRMNVLGPRQLFWAKAGGYVIEVKHALAAIGDRAPWEGVTSGLASAVRALRLRGR